MKEHYCIQHSHTKDIWNKYLDSYKGEYVCQQYEYGIQVNSTVSERWNRFMEIKEGDVLFLQNGHKIHAWGYVIKPRLVNKSGKAVTPMILSAVDVVHHRDHGMYRSDKSVEYIVFDDCEVFYENLEDGCNGWGQRIDVDEWRDWNPNGIPYVPIPGRTITKKISKAQAEEYIKKLAKKY